MSLSNWKYFTKDEFTCHCGCGTNETEVSLIDKLDKLRSTLGFPLIITSGYRCPDHNDKVSSTGRTGPHTTGKAADLGVSRKQAYEVLKVALNMGFMGIGINQKGGGRFIHLDMISTGRPTVWSY